MFQSPSSGHGDSNWLITLVMLWHVSIPFMGAERLELADHPGYAVGIVSIPFIGAWRFELADHPGYAVACFNPLHGGMAIGTG